MLVAGATPNIDIEHLAIFYFLDRTVIVADILCTVHTHLVRIANVARFAMLIRTKNETIK